MQEHEKHPQKGNQKTYQTYSRYGIFDVDERKRTMLMMMMMISQMMLTDGETDKLSKTQ